MEIQVTQNGPGGQPTAELLSDRERCAFSSGNGLPVNPDLETLNNSRIIQTNWGKSYLFTQGTTACPFVGGCRCSASIFDFG